MAKPKKGDNNDSDFIKIPKEYLFYGLGISFVAIVVLLVALLFVVLSGGRSGTVSTQQPVEQQQPSQFTQNIPSYQRDLQRNPKDLDALIGLGNGYFDSGDFQSAVTYYKKAVSIDPKNPNVITDLGVSYKNVNDRVNAKLNFEKAIKVNPKHQIAHLNLGIVLKELNNFAAAKAEWQKVIAIDPNTDAASQAKQSLALVK